MGRYHTNWLNMMYPRLRLAANLLKDDGVIFMIKRMSEIMDEAEYPGVRAMLEAQLDTMRTPLKIDISTGM